MTISDIITNATAKPPKVRIGLCFTATLQYLCTTNQIHTNP